MSPAGDSTLQGIVWSACGAGMTATQMAYVTALPDKKWGQACPFGTA